ncbi:MAG TPA: hypothetical protein VKB13_04870 [Gaiellaceae bacterium]|nr:hypothetical protein [Gaiellaceae bacterium]
MRLRVLNEAECYARCYGDHEDAVQVIQFERPRPSFADTLTGEDIRRLFELRLDARDPEVELEAA